MVEPRATTDLDREGDLLLGQRPTKVASSFQTDVFLSAVDAVMARTAERDDVRVRVADQSQRKWLLQEPGLGDEMVSRERSDLTRTRTHSTDGLHLACSELRIAEMLGRKDDRPMLDRPLPSCSSSARHQVREMLFGVVAHFMTAS